MSHTSQGLSAEPDRNMTSPQLCMRSEKCLTFTSWDFFPWPWLIVLSCSDTGQFLARDLGGSLLQPSSPQHSCLLASLLYRFWLPPFSQLCPSQYRLWASFISPFLCCGLERTVSWSSQGVCLCFPLRSQVACHGWEAKPVSHLNHEQTGLLFALKVL